MRKETDLARVKMIAHVLLDMPIAETSFSPAIVSHPFTSTGVTAAQNEDGNITVVDLLNNKEDYAKWKEMVGKQIDSAENACQVFFLLNKPYYLTFLKFSGPVLSQEDLGQLLAHAWILEECPNQDRNVSKRELLALFHSVPPELLMDKEEYAVYQSLEDSVTVYRGVTSYNAKTSKHCPGRWTGIRRSGLPTALVRRAPSMRLRFQRNTFLPFSTAGMNQKS